MKYVTWLLIPGGVTPDDDPALRVANELGARRGDLGRRPNISLRLEGERPRMVAATQNDAEILLTMIARARDSTLSVFSLLSVQHLRHLHERRIHHAGEVFTVEWSREYSLGPYCRRLLHIGKRELSAVNPALDSLIINNTLYDTCIKQCGSLFLAPVRIEFDSRQLSIFGELDALMAESRCVFLPPVRACFDNESYYWDERVKARQQIQKTVHKLQTIRYEPLALKAWRILDDPLIRDFVTEGAVIRPNVDCVTSALVLSLRPAPSRSPAAHYRQSFFGRLEDDYLPEGSDSLKSNIRRCFLSDLEQMGIVLQHRESELVADMDDIIPSQPSRKDREGDLEGSFDDIRWLWSRITEEGASESSLFRGLLNESNTIDPTLYAPDHALVEKLFIAHLWRCPWSNTTEMNAWRRTLLELLHAWRTNKVFDPITFNFQPDRMIEWPRLDVEGTTVEFTHLPHSKRDSDNFTYWLLLLPEGTIIREGGVFVLDDPEIRLDEGFVLA